MCAGGIWRIPRRKQIAAQEQRKRRASQADACLFEKITPGEGLQYVLPVLL